jgi:hypothetical protein
MENSSKKKSGLQRGESKAAFLFCTPAVVLALVFIILPFETVYWKFGCNRYHS